MRVSEVLVGTIIQPDAILKDVCGAMKGPVQQDQRGLFIRCAHGKHYLDGQLDFETGTFYVGFTRG